MTSDLARHEAERAAMGRALRLAQSPGVPLGPNPRVGCVLLAPDGTTIAEGFHRGVGSPHAEVDALSRAAERARGATAVVTLEPCVMCAGAMVLSRLPVCVFGTWDPKAGACGSVWDVARDPRANHRVEVVGGVRQEECARLLLNFFAARRLR